MKLKSFVLAGAAVLFVLTGRAQPYYVDLASLNTNIVDNYGWITISNASPTDITNAPYHTHNTNIVTGEFVLNAFQKVNSNTVWQVNATATNNTLWVILNSFIYDYAVTNGGTGYTFSGDTLTNGLFAGGTITNSAITNSIYSGKILDDTGASGTSGSILSADGSGGQKWIPPSVIPDSGGNGGTTLHLKASDTGGDVYIHVNSLGVVTASGIP